MRTLRQDVLYALRQMRLSPVFTLTAMLTLALGIGATTAIFSLIESVMLKSLPVADPSRLYRVGSGMKCCGQIGPQKEWGLFPYTLYQRIAADAPEFEQTAAFEAWHSDFSVRRADNNDPAKPLRCEYVSGNYFATLGLKAYVGRNLSQADDQPAAAPAAMLSHRVWEQEYGSDLKIVGSTYLLDGHPFTIVGVTPPGFFGETLRSDPPELFVPLQQEPTLTGGNTVLKTPLAWLRIIGRLRPGAETKGMPARFTTIMRAWLVSELGAEYPKYLDQLMASLPGESIQVIPAGGGVAEMKAGYESSLRILMAVCGLVLLIACANLANLLLARGSARGTQAAVRMAVGASKARLVRQSLTESVVLAVLGGAAGVVVAFAGVKIVVALAFHSARFVPIDARPSFAVLGFSLAMALITGLLFGAAPAWFASRTNPAAVLHGAGRSTRDGRALPQKTLVVVQAALSVVLLTGAGLLTRSLMKMEHQNFGFETDHRVSLRVNAPFSAYSPEKLDATYRSLKERLQRIPGVQGAALAMYTPFTNNWDAMVARQGQGTIDVNADNGSSWDRVSAGYLEMMGQRIVRGRSISEQDTASTPNIAVVDEAFVKKFFKPGEEPIGTHFGMNDAQYSGMYEIVGVVRTANYTDPSGHWRMPLLFVPLAQRAHFNTAMAQMIEDRSHLIEAVVLDLHGGMQGLEPQVRRAFAEVDANLTLVSIRTMDEQVADRMDQERAVSQLTGLFGILALALAAVGLYGVTAYGVERRTGEIGLRIALGADRAQVVAMVLRGAFTQILIGLAIGIPASIACARLIASQLYEVKGWDPVALGGSVAALAVCALVASLVPAWRAASINPVRALRAE
jgi:predicted permease